MVSVWHALCIYFFKKGLDAKLNNWELKHKLSQLSISRDYFLVFVSKSENFLSLFQSVQRISSVNSLIWFVLQKVCWFLKGKNEFFMSRDLFMALPLENTASYGGTLPLNAYISVVLYSSRTQRHTHSLKALRCPSYSHPFAFSITFFCSHTGWNRWTHPWRSPLFMHSCNWVRMCWEAKTSGSLVATCPCVNEFCSLAQHFYGLIYGSYQM